jgi:hypothetical protein
MARNKTLRPRTARFFEELDAIRKKRKADRKTDTADRQTGKRHRRSSRFLSRTPYGSLELSAVLDSLNHPEHPDHAKARAVVDTLIERGLRRATIGTFNRLFGKHAIPLRLHFGGSRYGTPGVSPDVPPTRISYALWKLLTSGDLSRFGKCPECGTYFFDVTRNTSKVYCTSQCTSRVMSRDYRTAGKEREARRIRRVTTKRPKSRPN